MRGRARDEILRRIDEALGKRRPSTAVPRDYRQRGDDIDARRLFVERVSDYGAEVLCASHHDVAAVVAEACARCGLPRIAVPPGLPARWRPDGVEIVVDNELAYTELDAIGAALTGAAGAIAETGTIVLDGSPACADVRSRSSPTCTCASSSVSSRRCRRASL